MQQLILQSLMFAASIIALLVGAYAWRQRSLTGGSLLSQVMLAVAIYSFSNAAELMSVDTSTKLLWAIFSYVGGVSLAPLWLLFSIEYNQLTRKLNRRTVVLLWILPAATLGLAITNEWHNLIWRNITPVSTLPGSQLAYDHGIAFWVHAAYAYTLLLVATYNLLRASRHSPQLFRLQSVTLFVAALIPWAGNLIYLFKLSPWPAFDSTSVAFGIAGLLIAYNLFRLRMLDLLPVAREALFENLSDGVIVLDHQNRILDINPIAREWMRLGDQVIGRDISEMIEQMQGSFPYQLPTQGSAQLEIGNRENRRVYNLTISPLNDKFPSQARSVPFGRVMMLHDITLERDMLRTAQNHVRQMETLNAITQAALNRTDLQTTLQVLVDQLGELFHADSVLLIVEDGRHLNPIIAAYGGWNDYISAADFLLMAKQMNDTVTNSKRAVIIDDSTSAPINLEFTKCFTEQSLIALPLRSEKLELGTALIGFEQQRTFTREDLSLLEKTANQIAVAILNVRLIESEQRRTSQLTALQSVSRTVTSSLELKEIMETVVQLLHDTFGYSLVSIYLLEKETMHLGAQVGYVEQNVYWTIPIDQGVLGRTVRSKQVCFIRDVSADQDFLRVSSDITSEICVPLIMEDTVLGALNVESTSHTFLSEEDVNLLITFANQVTVAINHAKLFEAEHLQKKTAEALFAATRDFTAGLNEEEVLAAIVEHVSRAAGAVGCKVLSWVPDTDSIETLIDYTAIPGAGIDTPGSVYPLENYPSTRSVIQSRRPTVINAYDLSVDPGERVAFERNSSESVLILPLTAGQSGQVFGVVKIYKHVREPFISGAGLELAQNLVAQAASAMENARLYSKVQRLSVMDELTGLHNRRGLQEIGNREYERAERFNRPLSVLFLDLDHFKMFNDHYSYAVGDQTLRQVANCLKMNLREIDIAGRYGGEEFIVFLPETDLASAAPIAERLRAIIEKTTVKTPQKEVRITVSIGICEKTHSLPNMDAIIDRAGMALHEAKSAGRNRIAIASFL